MYEPFEKTKTAIVQRADGRYCEMKLKATGFTTESFVIDKLSVECNHEVTADNVVFEIETFKREIRSEKPNNQPIIKK
jgi:hypothetical protein